MTERGQDPAEVPENDALEQARDDLDHDPDEPTSVGDLPEADALEQGREQQPGLDADERDR